MKMNARILILILVIFSGTGNPGSNTVHGSDGGVWGKLRETPSDGYRPP
jgi:hypothetical protein